MNMVEDLTLKICAPCQGGIPPLEVGEAKKLQAQTPGWELKEGVHHIFRRFEFNNFQESLYFVNKVGELAEKEGHHPDVEFGWGYAGIKIFTHKINGLHENDFILAAKINEL